MQQSSLGRSRERPILRGREEPSERPKSCPSTRSSKPKPSLPPIEPYFSAEAAAQPAPRLRPLTELEQMYAYWGSDRA